nr:threonine ammonia-lyase IlvA [Parvicella tangerina]
MITAKLNTQRASKQLKEVVFKTPLQLNANISKEHSCKVFLKREDLQSVRSYKIRGAYNKMLSLSSDQLRQGVVCASAGNHAQGVALSCNKLNAKGKIFMPQPTPKQKIEQVKMFGGSQIEVILVGDTFDDAKHKAIQYCQDHDMIFIHPFDDLKVIEGQSTVAKEILDQAKDPIDYLLLPVGGGGLAAGVSDYFKRYSPMTKIIAVEPKGAASLKAAMENDAPVTLNTIDKFIDGASVQRIGNLTFNFCQKNLNRVLTVDEGKVCSTILKLYNKDAIVVEPAGALALAALDQLEEEIKNKNVVCIVSGSNNDITRMEEIKERAMLYEKLKHYFLVKFPQRAGALKEYINKVLSDTDDITHFEYLKKNNREKGMIKIGIEVQHPNDLKSIISNMKSRGYEFTYLNENELLLQLLI